MKQIITIVVIILLGVLQTAAQNADSIKQAHSRQLKARYHTTLAQVFEQRAGRQNKLAQCYLSKVENYSKLHKYDSVRVYQQLTRNATEKAKSYARKAKLERRRARGYVQRTGCVM